MKDMQEALGRYKEWLVKTGFDVTETPLARKLRHIEGVVGFAHEIATERQLPADDVRLAEIIALLHDTGRFPQWKRYRTFWDRAVAEDGKTHPHAELGLELLFERGELATLFPDLSDEEQEIVRLAILNHSAFKIASEGMSERQIMHCGIIRDADKLDNIVNVIVQATIGELMDVEGYTEDDLWNSDLSPEVVAESKSGKLIDTALVKTPADHCIIWGGFIFDIVFPESLRIIERANCVDRIFMPLIGKFKKPEVNTKFEEIRVFLKKYISEKVA